MDDDRTFKVTDQNLDIHVHLDVHLNWETFSVLATAETIPNIYKSSQKLSEFFSVQFETGINTFAERIL